MKFFLFTVWLLLGISVSGQLYTFRNFNHRQGLNLSYITALAQDSSGYIWLGTDGAGLQCFDGHQMRSIETIDGDNEHHITSIDPDPSGIYFSSRYFGFFCYRNNVFERILEKDFRFGEHLLFRKNDDQMVFLGSKKIIVIKGGKQLISQYFKKNISEIRQCLEFPGGLLILSPENQFLIYRNQYIDLHRLLPRGAHIDAARIRNKALELLSFKEGRAWQIHFNKALNRKNVTIKNFVFGRDFHVKQAISKGEQLLLLDSFSNLYQVKHYLPVILPRNTVSGDFIGSCIYIDRNEDFWLGTLDNGLYKISLDPFTKIELDPVYRNPLISFIYRSQKNEIIISSYKNETYIGSFKKNKFDTYPIRFFSQCQHQGIDYFAGSDGIYTLKNGKPQRDSRFLTGTKIVFVFSYKDKIFYGPEGGGLREWCPQLDRVLIPPFMASHIYTAQVNHQKQKMYFGCNNGIIEYDLKNGAINHLKHKMKSGEYAGVSCTDSYGTMWFSSGKILVGITKKEKLVFLSNRSYFNSTLFYSLNSDAYGNIFIGTNKGITKLKLNEAAEVINSLHFDYNTGFEGFETHMRSSFKSDVYIYVGTIEGLFSINTKILEFTPPPPKPYIFQKIKGQGAQSNLDDPITEVQFTVINPKLKGIYYTYRLKGKNTPWSTLTTENKAYFSNLSDQDYTFEVRSTYDGRVFSPVASLKIKKFLPFWKTKWFVLVLIFTIALANILLLDRTKNYEVSLLIQNQDIEISPRIRTIIIGFGLVANISSQILVQQLEVGITNLFWVDISSAILLLITFFVSLFHRRFTTVSRYTLHTGLFVIFLQCYIGLFNSNIHPFFLIIILLCNTLIPYILQRLSEVLIVSIIHIISASALVLMIEGARYNEILFMIAIIVSVMLSLFITYIRNESLQKLIFISGIINKGNLLALAFDRTNRITYMTENWFNQLGIKPVFFVGEKLSALNKFVHQRFVSEHMDLEQVFRNKEKVTLPFRNESEQELWIEWTVQSLAGSVRVIFGQNVTDQVKLESNYETLVEYADDLIYFVDVNGHFLFANKAFKDRLGYAEEELLYRNSVVLAEDNYVDDVRNFYTHQFRERIQSTYHEFPIRKKDGSSIWVGQSTTLLFAPGSNKIVKGFLSLARDITEKREQQELIKDQHRKITDSISYARRIQQNLIPAVDELKLLYPEFEMVYQPRDVVSGDFYWSGQSNRYLFLVLADCTGHGVPGSFMTLLGINLLNQLLNDRKLTDPGDILNELDRRLQEILSRSGEQIIRDGMELVLLRTDIASGEIAYAAAGGHFLIQNTNGFNMLQGESKHIGDLPELNFTRYHTYEINGDLPERIYLFTDGLTDQLSEGINKRFSVKRFTEVIDKTKDLPIHKQVEQVMQKLKLWQGNAAQTDDLSLIVFKPRPQ